MTPARVLTSRRAVTLQRRQPQMGGRGAPTATAIGASLDTSIVAAFLSGWLAQGGRARSPDGGRGTRKLPFISIVFTIKLLSRMPLRPAPAPARAAFPPKVPSGLTGRAPAWGAALSGRCPSRVARTGLGAQMRISAVRGQSRSERTNTVVGQSYASIMDILAPHLHAEAIGTAQGLRRRAGLLI